MKIEGVNQEVIAFFLFELAREMPQHILQHFVILLRLGHNILLRSLLHLQCGFCFLCFRQVVLQQRAQGSDNLVDELHFANI